MKPPTAPAATAPPSPARAIVGVVNAATAITGTAAITANRFMETSSICATAVPQYVAGLVRFACPEVSPDSVSSGLTKQGLALNASKNWQSSLQNTKSLHSNFLLYLRELNACGLMPPARFA
jgi:hypothetical protein